MVLLAAAVVLAFADWVSHLSAIEVINFQFEELNGYLFWQECL